MHYRQLFAPLVVILVLLTIAPMTLAQQDASVENLRLFVEENSLTLYVSAEEEVSLEGFQFSVFR
ncbi:MAG: hypothetical protein D6737_04905, partial [Chloroflexi bacterium]